MYKFAQALRRMRKEERGFTLVELMVVVVIIGVLAAVAIPKFGGIIDNSKVKADVATAKTIKDSVDRFYTDKGSYPADFAALTSGNYLSQTPKVAQGDGTAAAASVFTINTTTGQVQAFKVTGSNSVSTTTIWDSNS